MDRRAVIIGGGITGILTARELLLDGWDVVVLETAHVGAGSSSRTAAGIRQQFSTPDTVRGMRYCVDFYRRFGDETEEGVSAIVQNGYLFLHTDEAAWSQAIARVAMQQSVGLHDVEALDSDALRQRFPFVDSDAIRGGTYCPSDGFLLPHVVYNDGARRVRQLGGQIIQGAAVTGAQVDGDRIVTVETPKGPFSADLFIDATNAWTRRTAGILGAEPLDVDPLKRYLWFLERDGTMTPDDLTAMPLTIAPSGAYCRPENPETLLMGKKHETPPRHGFDYEDQDEIEPAFSHKTGIDAVPFELWAELAEALPPLGEFGGVSATTCGYYGTTPDHNPFLGFDRRRPNLLRLVGFSGHGAMLGPFTALAARTLAEAGRDVPTLDVCGEPVQMGVFQIGRAYDNHETMVI